MLLPSEIMSYTIMRTLSISMRTKRDGRLGSLGQQYLQYNNTLHFLQGRKVRYFQCKYYSQAGRGMAVCPYWTDAPKVHHETVMSLRSSQPSYCRLIMSRGYNVTAFGVIFDCMHISFILLVAKLTLSQSRRMTSINVPFISRRMNGNAFF